MAKKKIPTGQHSSDSLGFLRYPVTRVKRKSILGHTIDEYVMKFLMKKGYHKEAGREVPWAKKSKYHREGN